MYFSYQKLAAIHLRHDYQEDGRLRAFTASPAVATGQLSRRYGLAFRFTPGEIGIYTDNTRIRPDKLPDSPIALRFLMMITDPSFFSYTDLQHYEPRDHLLYFHNKKRPLAENRPNTHLLHRLPFATAECSRNRALLGNQQSLRKPTAVIDFLIGPGLLSEYQVQFSPRATYWNYVLVSEQLRQLQKPAIRHSTRGDTFLPEGPRLLPDGRESLFFRSPHPIPLKERPDRGWQLLAAGRNGRERVILPSLPAPDILRFSALPDTSRPTGSPSSSRGTLASDSHIFL